MSRTTLTQVEYSDLIKIANHLGLNVVENKGFTKCYAAGKTKPPALGIPNTTKVTRVELVGFNHAVGIAHPKPPAKTVEQMLDFSKASQADILKDFLQVARHVANSAGARVVETAEEAMATCRAQLAKAVEEFEAEMKAAEEADEMAAAELLKAEAA